MATYKPHDSYRPCKRVELRLANGTDVFQRIGKNQRATVLLVTGP